MAKIKNKVQQLRKDMNLRQEDLANLTKVTRQTIIAIENERYNPSLELALKISKVFGKSVEEIFKLED